MSILAEGIMVQRDCFAAFLRYCFGCDCNALDKDKCKAELARLVKQIAETGIMQMWAVKKNSFQ